jgi:hypothetical protein
MRRRAAAVHQLFVGRGLSPRNRFGDNLSMSDAQTFGVAAVLDALETARRDGIATARRVAAVLDSDPLTVEVSLEQLVFEGSVRRVPVYAWSGASDAPALVGYAPTD